MEREDVDSVIQTQYVAQDLEPRWNESLVWDITGTPPAFVRLHVHDFDELGEDDLMGVGTVPFVQSHQPVESWSVIASERSLFDIGGAVRVRERGAFRGPLPVLIMLPFFFFFFFLKGTSCSDQIKQVEERKTH